MKNYSVYHWNQKRNNVDNKCSSLPKRYLFNYFVIFDYKVCVKDRTGLRIAIPAYCFHVFG